MHISRSRLEEILRTAPPDYYQKGVKRNILQKLWHTGKLKTTKSLMNKSCQRVLDVGCASGWFLSEISRFVPHTECVGIDLYKEAIEYGNRRYKKLKLICADAHKLPFAQNSFDLVLCHEVLEHVVDPKKVLKEIRRVVRPEGHVIIEMDSGNKLFKVVWYFWHYTNGGVWKGSHLHTFNTKKLENMIENNGFTIKQKNIFNWSMGVIFLVEPC